jgi:hypothetical protein
MLSKLKIGIVFSAKPLSVIILIKISLFEFKYMLDVAVRRALPKISMYRCVLPLIEKFSSLSNGIDRRNASRAINSEHPSRT